MQLEAVTHVFEAILTHEYSQKPLNPDPLAGVASPVISLGGTTRTAGSGGITALLMDTPSGKALGLGRKTRGFETLW